MALLTALFKSRYTRSQCTTTPVVNHGIQGPLCLPKKLGHPGGQLWPRHARARALEFGPCIRPSAAQESGRQMVGMGITVDSIIR